MLFQTGQLFSNAGTQASSIAYPFLVLALTHSAVRAGVVSFARTLPLAVLSIPAGVAADHFNRRTLMIAADAVRGGAIGALAVSLVAFDPPFWVIPSWPSSRAPAPPSSARPSRRRARRGPDRAAARGSRRPERPGGGRAHRRSADRWIALRGGALAALRGRRPSLCLLDRLLLMRARFEEERQHHGASCRRPRRRPVVASPPPPPGGAPARGLVLVRLRAFLVWPTVYVLAAGLVPVGLAIPSTDSVVNGYRIAITPDRLLGRSESVRNAIALSISSLSRSPPASSSSTRRRAGPSASTRSGRWPWPSGAPRAPACAVRPASRPLPPRRQ